MNNYYTIPSEYNGGNLGFAEPIRNFKGTTELFFDMTYLLNGGESVINIVIDFNDGTPLYKRYFSYEDNNELEKIISHTYHPTNEAHYIVYYPTFFIKFSNFNTLIYQATVKISKESFYSQYKKISVASCQFIDNIDNSMFVTFDTAKGDILNLKIK